MRSALRMVERRCAIMSTWLGLGLGLGVGLGVGVGVGRRCAIMRTVMPPYISPTSPLHIPGDHENRHAALRDHLVDGRLHGRYKEDMGRYREIQGDLGAI